MYENTKSSKEIIPNIRLNKSSEVFYSAIDIKQLSRPGKSKIFSSYALQNLLWEACPRAINITTARTP